MRTALDPWCARLLAIVSAAPLLYCGGNTSGGDDDGDATGARGGASSVGGSTGSGGSRTTTGSGGSGAAGGTIGTGGSGTGGTGPRPCTNPTPLDPDYETGFETCDGFVHRPEARTCESLLPREPDWTPSDLDACTEDTDCTEKPHGYCDWADGNVAGRSCHYGCTTDAECGAGMICQCSAFIGYCVESSCTTDADCGAGLLCATYGVCYGSGYACQTPQDSCSADSDCASGLCELTADGTRQCADLGCPVIGRPFLVADELRTAPPAVRSDWSGEATPELESISEQIRAALGAAWLRVALMEHASVAAFARFTLELLAVGAPAELVRDSTAAALDETRHAELCFALASAYSGTAQGPGPLRVEGALDGASLEKLVATAVHEGCVGETVAAIEAAEQAEHARDPAVRGVLERISRDETRHAELAWRFVAWALERGGERLRAVAAREFGKHFERPPRVEAASDVDLREHGVLCEAFRAELRASVVEQVVRPCAKALLSSPASSRTGIGGDRLDDSGVEAMAPYSYR